MIQSGKAHGAWRRGLKIALMVAIVAGAILQAGCEEEDDGPGRGRTNFRDSGEFVYFEFKDPPYDDKGPGTYTYPLIAQNNLRRAVLTQAQGGTTGGNPDGVVGNATEDNGTSSFSLDAKTGFFDITDFRVVDGGSDVIFEITTQRPIPQFRDDSTSEAKGWFLQLMDIYIDRGHKPGTGRTRTLPGRNVSFAPKDAWDKMIYVTPQVSWDVRRLIEQITWDMDFVRMKKDIIIPDTVLVQGYTFSVYVPKGLIGTPKPGWGYQCLMMLFDPSNLEVGHFQEGKVQRFAGNNVFGGADEYGGHPNVIDMLAPTPEAQYSALSNYASDPNAGANRYAIIPMMHATQAPAHKTVARARAKGRNAIQGLRIARQVSDRARQMPGDETADGTGDAVVRPARLRRQALVRAGATDAADGDEGAPPAPTTSWRRRYVRADASINGDDDTAATPLSERRVRRAPAVLPADIGSDAEPPAESDDGMFSNTDPVLSPQRPPIRRSHPRNIKVDHFDDTGDGD